MKSTSIDPPAQRPLEEKLAGNHIHYGAILFIFLAIVRMIVAFSLKDFSLALWCLLTAYWAFQTAQWYHSALTALKLAQDLSDASS